MDKHEEFLHFSLIELIDKSLHILKFELHNSSDLFSPVSSNPHFFKILSIFETEEQKINYWRLYSSEIQKSREDKASIRIQSKSNHIYLLALFERYRNGLLSHAYTSSKKHKDTYREFTTTIAEREKDQTKKTKLLTTIARNPDNLIQHVDNLFGRQFEVERNMFGLRDIKDDIFIQEVLSNFIISREIRNLLIHRSEQTDKKLFSSIKHGVSGTIFNKKDKNLSALLKNKGYISLHKLEIGKPINIDAFTIFILVLDILYMSFHMTSNALNKKYSGKLENLLAHFLNSALCIYFSNKIDDKVKYLFIFKLNHQIDKLINSARNNIDFNSDILLANYIVLKKQVKNSAFSIRNLSSDDLKESFSRAKNIETDVETDFRKSLKLIKNTKIKKIVSCYYKDDDLGFIKSIHDFGGNELNSWSMVVDKVRSSVMLKNYITSMDKKNWEEFKSTMSKDEVKEN